MCLSASLFIHFSPLYALFSPVCVVLLADLHRFYSVCTVSSRLYPFSLAPPKITSLSLCTVYCFAFSVHVFPVQLL